MKYEVYGILEADDDAGAMMLVRWLEQEGLRVVVVTACDEGGDE